MRRTKLFSLITTTAFVLAACGAPAPSEAPAPTQPPAAPTAAIQAVEATPQPTPTLPPESKFKRHRSLLSW